MHRFILMWSGALAIVGSVGLMAQTPAKGQRPADESPSAGVVATVTATGCLERWTADLAAPPTDAGPDKGPAGVMFVLTHVEGETVSSATSTTTSTPPAAAEPRYLLLPSSRVTFAAHLNQKVTISGSIAPQPEEGATAAEQATQPTTRETNLTMEPKAKAYTDNLVDVASLSVVSRSCR